MTTARNEDPRDLHTSASIRAARRAYTGKRTPPHVWEEAREVLIDAGLLSAQADGRMVLA